VEVQDLLSSVSSVSNHDDVLSVLDSLVTAVANAVQAEPLEHAGSVSDQDLDEAPLIICVEDDDVHQLTKHSPVRVGRQSAEGSSKKVVSGSVISVPLSPCSGRLLKLSQRPVLSSGTKEKSKSQSMQRTKDNPEKKQLQTSDLAGSKRRHGD